MNIILFDTEARTRFFPLTLTRAMADLRMGIFTIKERWEKVTGAKVFVLTDPYLQRQYGEIPEGEYLLVDPAVIISDELLEKIKSLGVGEALYDHGGVIYGRFFFTLSSSFSATYDRLFEKKIQVENIRRIEQPSNLFEWNKEFLAYDFQLVFKNVLNRSNSLVGSVLINEADIFIQEGAEVNCSILNASTGPIYIGKNATIMEGCTIRGPFAMCEGAMLKMGTKVYGATTLGPYCVGGGEIKNAILMGYSNKAHDGYLADSVVGEWCNMGAGTSNSNLKNTAGNVRVWNHYENDYVTVGMKCGLIMGDYSRTSINTSINTGTVIGVCCNVFGEGLTPKLIANFTWGMKELSRYEFEKALKDLDNWKKMKNKSFTQTDSIILKHIFDNYND